MIKAINEFVHLKSRIDKFELNMGKCSKANRTKGYYEGRMKAMEDLFKEVVQVDKQIESFKTDETATNNYFEDDEFGEIEAKCFNIIGKIKDELETFTPNPVIVNNQNGDGNQSFNQNSNNNDSKVKLPKISLPTFEGSYHTWLSFKNRYTTLIHDSGLSKVEKLTYLKSCLTGEAARTIQRYQITDQNYDVAWKQLNDKYDNKRILQVTQVETIIDRQIMKTETASELRELIDVVQECLEALKNLDVDIGSWDIMLIVLIVRKLSFKTREHWEQELEPSEVPTYAKLMDFLEKRYRTVENLELVGGVQHEKGSKDQAQYSGHKGKQNQSSQQRPNCVACNSSAHVLMICEKFLNMSGAQRVAFVNAKRLCRNCLGMGHQVKDCKSTRTCFNCRNKHHTLLHKDEANQSKEPMYEAQYPSSGQAKTYVTHQQYRSANVQRGHQNQRYQSTQQKNDNEGRTTDDKKALTTGVSNQGSNTRNNEETLFPTAILQVKSAGGMVYNIRALLDQCSEDDAFIKESVVTMLGLRKQSIPAFEITGLDETVTSTIDKTTKFEIRLGENETLEVDASIVKTLVGILPKTIVKCPKGLFKNIRLADTTFATPGSIDIMLGGRIYAELLLSGVMKEDGYIAQNTKLGWIISGKGNSNVTVKRTFTCLHSKRVSEPDEILRKFWEMEEAPRKAKQQSDEEKKCEEIFKNSYRIMDDGRRQVRLPFKEIPTEALGQSRNQAVARWLSMERKLEKDPVLKQDYMSAIQEHIDLGHLGIVSSEEINHRKIHHDGSIRSSCYYIPHHAVVREESKTTKTRIVFDASAKTATGKSLNDILMVGPTIQESLIVRLMKWRKKKFALRGDVTKMYRQVKVYDEDVNYQRMVFRFDKKDPIQDFCLNTLTFGTASAPYMAIRTLKQVAIDGEQKYLVGSQVVRTDFHVDDLLTGGDTIQEVKQIWKQVSEMLGEAKFPMRKWSSNSNAILDEIPEEEREFKAAEIQIEDTLKTLGIGWSPIEDYFFVDIPEYDVSEKLKKRTFLSQAAKLFDPLGWLGPVVVKPKIMFQSLWKDNLKWDDNISARLAQEWTEFRNELKQLEKIKISRWFGFKEHNFKKELHGFSDASEKAFGAVIYVKSTNVKGESQVELVIAKSRVAPVQTVRLPRLELCGGVLLANLIDMVRTELEIDTAYCWTDSSITLDWINSDPDKHKTFVANRIAEIQEFTKAEQWRHVDGTQNPADCLSRGISPKELVEHNLWWNGPAWLKWPKERWPMNPNVKSPEDQMELKVKKVVLKSKIHKNDFIKDLWSRYSSFNLLVRVTARMRTWKNKIKSKVLSVSEVQCEMLWWIRLAQNEQFPEEIEALKNGQPVSGKSKLCSLNPFLDGGKVLRVGGRLKAAELDFESKHQIIIPKNSQISKLIINDAHENTKHGGTQLTMAYTRHKYWIVDTRRTVRNQIHKCVKCHRYSKKMQGQLMGTLPEARVNMTRAFLHTGVDYAGPFQILTIKKPGKRQVTKGYVAVFVCLCTKAIYLELVSSLKSELFLAAFTRFSSRRGLPSNMYSDNSTTFIGAKNELDEGYSRIKEVLEPELAQIILKNDVQWSFIPPHAPHWGGIWEAGVKSMKYHLKRIVGETVYTYEEFTTMLTEIEACLNSRPLCPVTEDPNDLSILTPGHFLIGDSILLPPRPSLIDINVNKLGLYNQISQRVEHFNRRWKREYLSNLQQRNKWQRQNENVEVGDMVVIKEDNLPASRWLLGRVTEVFPDEEGLVRKVVVRTATTNLTRPIHKISILPIDKPILESQRPSN